LTLWGRFGVALILVVASALACAATYTGKVIKVVDGDTLHVLYQGGALKVRLSEIDTPERGQPWYQRAKDALAEKVAARVVSVEEVDRDRYGRLVGKVWLDGRDINREMVAGGHAWVYRRYLRDPSLLEDENHAQAALLGLWRLPETQRTPPWEWRRR
jgi:endonuclease YncB( thermonuclease family)